MNEMVTYFSAVHLQMVERYLRPNVDYFLKDSERSSIFSFIGIDVSESELVLTNEANKKPLKLVYNSDRAISFYSTTMCKWLRINNWNVVFDQQNIEDASKFEPLIGSDKSDGVVLRSVHTWENLCAIYGYGLEYVFSRTVGASKGQAIKFNFLPVN